MKSEYQDITDPKEPYIPTHVDMLEELWQYWEATRTLQETLDYAKKAYWVELIELPLGELKRRYGELQRLTGEWTDD